MDTWVNTLYTSSSLSLPYSTSSRQSITADSNLRIHHVAMAINKYVYYYTQVYNRMITSKTANVFITLNTAIQIKMANILQDHMRYKIVKKNVWNRSRTDFLFPYSNELSFFNKKCVATSYFKWQQIFMPLQYVYIYIYIIYLFSKVTYLLLCDHFTFALRCCKNS